MLIKVKPKKMSVYVANGKLTCAQVRKKTGCDICINGTLYNMKNYAPVCDVKIDGKIMSNDECTYLGYGWNNGDARAAATLSSEMYKLDNFISCVMMVYNGAATQMYYGSALDGKRGRTAFGYDKDGNMIIYVSKDRTSDACNPKQLQAKFLSYGCVDAIMLDGGGSSQFDSDEGKVTSSRKVANYICIWVEDDGKEKCPYKEPTSNVRKNTRGTGAKWVQWYLNKTMNAGLDVDGIFGKLSVAALIEFQTNNGLDVDGICGKKTRVTLKERYKE